MSTSASPLPDVTVAVLAFGEEPDLAESVRAVLASEGVEVSVRLVDNGCDNPVIDELAQLPGVQLIRPAYNTGFTGGCDLALTDASTQFVAAVNSDAVVRPDALAELVAVAGQDDVGITCADVRFMDRPEIVNSRGNPLHITGLVWAGGLGEPARQGPPDDVASASGATIALRTELWNELGGFPIEFFAYHEDVDLSLRTWGRGLRVVHVPSAVALHRYEFSRNPLKMYLLERNRLATVITVYPRTLLLRLLPVLVVTELGLALAAAAGGWLPAKVRGWWWLVKHAGWLARRRRQVQSEMTPDAAQRIADLMTPTFSPAVISPPAGLLALANAFFKSFWRIAQP